VKKEASTMGGRWIRAAALAAALAAGAAGLAAGPAQAQDRAGDFDHFVLALSWSPAWCATEGAGRAGEAAQCDPRAARGFVVHGLWPQHEEGWPEHCPTDARGPSRRETAAMADIMPSGELAWAQWRKHGRCTGLSGAAYLDLTREAARRVTIPPGLARPGEPARVDPRLVEAAFRAANPGFPPDGITVTCRDGLLREVRLCMDRALRPRACAPDSARDCPARSVTLEGAPD
jgi:ribonuclease T2